MARRSLTINPAVEIAEVQLGDRRLNERASVLTNALGKAPGRSLPVAAGSAAGLEAAYRFFGNDRVTLPKLLAPHVAATVERARGCDATVIVAHDTTEFRFEGETLRPGLGEVGHGGQGFLAHVALAITEERLALGVLGVQVVVRAWDRAKHRKQVDYAKRSADNEGTRWRALIEEVQALASDTLPIHVMDREADEFSMLSDMVAMGCRFVVRMSVARHRRVNRVNDRDARQALVADAISSLRGVAKRDVKISARVVRRASQARGPNGARDRRAASLHYSAGVLEIAPPHHKTGSKLPVTLNVVHVFEPAPPAGEEPVDWVLYSNEPVRTESEVLAIVDAYRARWVIEEYFKALKTGCMLEQRQLESLDSLVNCLGLFVPIAARMLALRSHARVNPGGQARSVLSTSELGALRLVARTKLAEAPTTQEALWAIAALGGHLRNNGDPGWLTLARGFEVLQIAVQVASATREK